MYIHDLHVFIIKTIFQVIKSFLLPHVKDIGEKVKIVLEGPILNSADKIAAENIKKSLAVSVIVVYSFWFHDCGFIQLYEHSFSVKAHVWNTVGPN